jgi:hypothetical protein
LHVHGRGARTDACGRPSLRVVVDADFLHPPPKKKLEEKVGL